MDEIPEAAVDRLARTLHLQATGHDWDHAGGAARADFREAAHDELLVLAPLIEAAELERFADSREKFAREIRLRDYFGLASESFAVGIEHDVQAARDRARELRGGPDSDTGGPT